MWREEYDTWRQRRLDNEQWVYLWVDGIYSGRRAETQRLCALVVIGVNSQGEKQLLAIEDGVRESTQSWREVLLHLKARGMNAPGIGHWRWRNGFLGGRRGNLPEHAPAAVLGAQNEQGAECVAEKWAAESETGVAGDLAGRDQSRRRPCLRSLSQTYEAKYPKATACLEKDRQELLACYAFPASHWQSLRTTNPIESTFGTMRHRTKRTKGCLTRDGLFHMMFKLGRCAEKNWRRLRGFKKLEKVITGIHFMDGIEETRFDPVAA